MPRKTRIDAPSAYHPIIVLGMERNAIFIDSADQANFLERLCRILSETETMKLNFV